MALREHKFSVTMVVKTRATAEAAAVAVAAAVAATPSAASASEEKNPWTLNVGLGIRGRRIPSEKNDHYHSAAGRTIFRRKCFRRNIFSKIFFRQEFGSGVFFGGFFAGRHSFLIFLSDGRRTAVGRPVSRKAVRYAFREICNVAS